MGQRNTGIFIDAENLIGGYGGGRKAFDMDSVMQAVRLRMEEIRHAGRALVCRAYADWARAHLPDLRRQLRRLGVETVHVEASSLQAKNAADIHLAIDALTWAFEKPSMEVVILVSGDGGLVPLVRQLQALDRYVVGAAREGSASEMLKGVCDDFLELAPASSCGPPAHVSTLQLDVRTAVQPHEDRRWDDELVAVTEELLDGAQSVDFQRVMKVLRERLGVTSVAELTSGTRPIDASARVFADSEFVLARYPENPGVWLVMRRAAVPDGAQLFQLSESDVGLLNPELPVMRSGAGAGSASPSPSRAPEYEGDDGAGTAGATWFRDAEVARALVPEPPRC